MILKNDEFTVEITTDASYEIGSLNNKLYDIVLNPDNYLAGKDHFYKVLSISVESKDRKISIAMIGSYYTVEADCAVLRENTLTVLQDDRITQINMADGTVLKSKEAGYLGCNFGIYQVKQGFLIYGELNITLLDHNLNKKWMFSGRDIFVSISGKESFKISEQSIQLYDFQDNYYELDFGGRVIKEIKAEDRDRGSL